MYIYNKKFYKEYGFKVTDEPIGKMSSEAEQDAYDHSYHIIFSGEGIKEDIQTIKDYIQKYPNSPAFKNHLSVLYGQLDMDLEARKMALEVINRHPDYLFGRTKLAEMSLQEGNLNLAKKMLGEPRNIRTFKPNVDVYHYSEFMAYHAVAGMYEMEIGDRDAAEKNLELMIEYDPDHKASKVLAMKIITKGFEGTQNRMEADQAIRIEVNSFPTYTPEPTDVPPKLHHEELEAFYLYSSDELPEEIMTDIMQLPRETLITDLEAILEDGIRRNKYLQEKYIEAFNESEMSFMVHAAYFLGALEAKESLNAILNVFRQGEEFIDYWFSDYFHNFFEEVLFLMAKDQAEILKNYVLEPNQCYSSRTAVLDALTQIALHVPEGRDKIIGYFKEICEYHLKRPDDKTIIDTGLLTHLAGCPIDLREPALLDYSQQIDDRKWLGYMMYGDLAEIKKETHLPPEAADIKPMPQNIYEFYNNKHLQRRAKRSNFEESESRLNSKVANYLTDIMIGGLSGGLSRQDDSYDDAPAPSRHEYQEPVVRETPKISRNASCPCGSGKKYKRCCLKKAG